MLERTVIVFKPDAVARGLVGEILSRFEKAGLRIVGCKTVQVGENFVSRHYPAKEDFLRGMGLKSLQNYAELGLDPKKELGTDDPLTIGRKIRRWNMVFLSRGPVIAIVLEGNHAISNVRKMVGTTIPSSAPPGTIRGDYSIDSAIQANREKRAIHNLIHASSDPEEAVAELKLWFKDHELV